MNSGQLSALFAVDASTILVSVDQMTVGDSSKLIVVDEISKVIQNIVVIGLSVKNSLFRHY